MGTQRQGLQSCQLPAREHTGPPSVFVYPVLRGTELHRNGLWQVHDDQHHCQNIDGVQNTNHCGQCGGHLNRVQDYIEPQEQEPFPIDQENRLL